MFLWLEGFTGIWFCMETSTLRFQQKNYVLLKATPIGFKWTSLVSITKAGLHLTWPESQHTWQRAWGLNTNSTFSPQVNNILRACGEGKKNHKTSQSPGSKLPDNYRNSWFYYQSIITIIKKWVHELEMKWLRICGMRWIDCVRNDAVKERCRSQHSLTESWPGCTEMV